MQETNTTTSNSEISLSEIGGILAKHKKLVVGLPILAAIVAAIVAMLIKPQWEASAAVQIGAIGTDQGKQLVEPVPRVVARMKLEAFEDAVLKGLKIPEKDGDPRTKLYRRSLKVKAFPNTDLIEIRIRGHSPQEAKRFIEGTVDYLHRVHRAMAQPSIQRMKQLLAQVEREMAVTKAERDRALRVAGLRKKKPAASDFTENVLRDNILIQRDRDLRALEQTREGLKEQLDPARTYLTSYIETVSVSQEPVWPRKTPLVFVAGVLGLIAGVIAALVSNALKK